jgi:ABC-type multidrug transport system fused ATPase/permease subunit
MTLYRRAVSLLDDRARTQLAGVVVVVVVMALFEVVGVSSIVPFLSVLANPDLVHEQSFLSRLYEWSGSESPRAFLRTLGLASFALLVASAGTRSVGMYLLARFAQNLRHTIGTRLLDTYLRRPYEFFLNRHSSDLAKNILSESDLLVNQVYQPATSLLSNSVTLIALTTLVVAIDPTIALAIGAILGSAYLSIYVGVRSPIERIGKQRVAANQLRFEATSEALGGVKELKLLGRESGYLEKFKHPSAALARLAAKAMVLGQFPRYAVETIGLGGILLLSLSIMTSDAGTPNAQSASSGIPLLGLYALAGYRMLPAVQAIYLAATQIRFGAPAIEAVYDELRGTEQLPSFGRSAPLRVRDELRVLDLAYSYPDTETGISDISFSVPAGSTLGIVGTTGAGKSTLVDVLLGLLWPSQGTLHADGVQITQDNVRAWQASIGYVPQTIFLADASLRENIAFGTPPTEIDDERVRECIRLAQLDDYVASLPAGVDTPVGERGVRLSGGQRQRIGIARSLYHDPDVIVFDEATSALDNATERTLMDSVLSLQGTKTIIMIAHRLSTVRTCDQIIVLDRGRNVGMGTFAQLEGGNRAFQAIASSGVGMNRSDHGGPP